MPELPEVETIKNQLQDYLPIEIDRMVLSSVVESILKVKNRSFDPTGMMIKNLSRKGKMLCFHLNNRKYILSHLGMSGSWRISKTKIKEKHTHLQFEARDKNQENIFLAYIDPRRFGNMYFLNQEEKNQYYQKLGTDISSKEFNEEYLKITFEKFPNKILKPFLLDQKYFAGCGNYIASEICALSKILPTRKCQDIKKSEYKKIIKATKEVINSQIKNNGLTFSGGYQDAFGDKGEGVKNLVVFHQKICGMCKRESIKKIVLAQRGTFFCPYCQK